MVLQSGPPGPGAGHLGVAQWANTVASDAGTVEQWAGAAWALLKAQGQRIVREGKTLESDEDNLAEITAQARAFEAKKLPLLRKLGVV